MSTNQRIRGRRLQRIRDRHFRLRPLCVYCSARGLIRRATQLDHIVAIDNGGEDVDSNRQGLCDECHEAKTRRDLGQVQRSGASVDGMPSDPNHHWNR